MRLPVNKQSAHVTSIVAIKKEVGARLYPKGGKQAGRIVVGTHFLTLSADHTQDELELPGRSVALIA